MKGNILKFRADDAKAEQIKQAADKEGISVSEYIRMAVDDRLNGTKPVTQKKAVTQPNSDFERFKRYRVSDSRTATMKDSLFRSN